MNEKNNWKKKKKEIIFLKLAGFDRTVVLRIFHRRWDSIFMIFRILYLCFLYRFSMAKLAGVFDAKTQKLCRVFGSVSGWETSNDWRTALPIEMSVFFWSKFAERVRGELDDDDSVLAWRNYIAELFRE